MLSVALAACLAGHLVYTFRLARRIRDLEIRAFRLDRKIIPFR